MNSVISSSLEGRDLNCPAQADSVPSDPAQLGTNSSIISIKIIWFSTIIFLGLGVSSEIFTALGDHSFSIVELSQISSTSLIFFSWIYFKPKDVGMNARSTKLNYPNNSLVEKEAQHLKMTQARMAELEQHHLISQEYDLPFPYFCQIYHLLNLKHLERVHRFSLSNLKITAVSHFQPTDQGGTIKFQTALQSSMNTLRIWRRKTVEAALTLHNPYTVELSIPVYNSKKIIVIFNALPLNAREHRLCIDIYSTLNFPKPVLQFLLHIASCLTLFEDLPYLRKLSERNLEHLIQMGRVSNHETMFLFKRFAELYGNSVLGYSNPMQQLSYT
jgi:hypothetical protein